MLALETATNPVVLLAGELKKSAALLKMVEASERAVGVVSYPVDDRNAEALVGEQANTLGLRLAPGGAARIAVAAAAIAASSFASWKNMPLSSTPCPMRQNRWTMRR